MKTTDLMIGDWVNYRPGWIDEETKEVVYEIKTGFPIRLTCLYDGLSQYDDVLPDGSINTIEVADYELFAIPITPEILKKNGFTIYEQDFTSNTVYKFGSLDYMEFNGFDNYFDIGSKITYMHFGRKITYIHSLMRIYFVHELQHALRLCGIKKELVL